MKKNLLFIFFLLFAFAAHAQKKTYVTYTKFDALRYPPEFSRNDGNCTLAWNCVDALHKDDPQHFNIKIDSCASVKTPNSKNNIQSLQEILSGLKQRQTLTDQRDIYFLSSQINGKWQAYKIISINDVSLKK